VFFPLKAPIVHFALSSVVFCLDFDPFFFSSHVSLPNVFPLLLLFIPNKINKPIWMILVNMYEGVHFFA